MSQTHPRGPASRSRSAIVVAVAIIVAVFGVLVVEQATTPPRHVRPQAITMTYAGDSTTAQPDSWLFQLDDSRVVVTSGFAQSGDTSAQIRFAVKPTKADVLVVMLGANNFKYPVTASNRRVVSDIDGIVKKVGAGHPVISAVAPSDFDYWPNPAGGSRAILISLNRAIKADATRHGWSYIDPYASIRDPDTDAYTQSRFTSDGVHPSATGYRIVARALIGEILRAARGNGGR